ncbi:MAG TPA: NADH-quinone oxidoreductase subunit H [Solirubrobacteraceae bacterium]|nr:NADH-quinone oxidoreductase subunit H [Solirubrobacteraceae bacterium]
MSSVVAAALQVGGVAIAPLVPGTIQTLKARMQGRRGASPLQPYRVLRRLWGKSTVDPEGAGLLYRLAPAIAAASLLLAFALVPLGGRSGAWGLGNDALVFVGLLALARFVMAVAAWDPGNGFALMGVARDLTLAVFGEALLTLALLLAVLPAHSTDLIAMTGAAGGSAVWSHAAHWCGAFAFALVVLLETGRQPIDNPDTHLELTMIHEGPLLEYAGRDLAYLTWVAAARHWLVLALAAGLFLPHPRGFAGSLVALLGGVVAACVVLAVTETAQAKMRILRVPALLGLGCLVALAGLATSIAGGP